MNNKKILFLTGTRADFGKMKSIISIIENSSEFESYVFITGMHMLPKYGSTVIEVEREGYKNIHKWINQDEETPPDKALSNTIIGLSDYVKEIKPDMIVVHGDRLEALAGAIVGAFNNIFVAHIEGGEVSGTIDESIRHSISKMAHFHFVANEKARSRLVQIGENSENIFIIGSPDIDIMLSENLPSIEIVKKYYKIPFEKYSVLMYHPVTTELNLLKENIKETVSSIIESKKNYIVIYPNNDLGSDIILKEFERLMHRDNFIVIPSMRFEYFLTLLKNSDFIIGNSSAGIREAEVYSVPCINLGDRQKNRSNNEDIMHVSHNKEDILKKIELSKDLTLSRKDNFGKGDSAKMFYEILNSEGFFNISLQKEFFEI